MRDIFMNRDLFIRSTRNATGNAGNVHQGNQPRILCVCSAGLLRSATMADILVKSGKYNVRNCGTALDYALIPLSSALLQWADKICVVKEQLWVIEEALEMLDMTDAVDVISLDIPDIYERNNPELVEIITQRFKEEGIL